MEWFAELGYSFNCPECEQKVPEGNPKECPRQQGKPARYSGKKPVVNAAKLIAVLSVQPKTPSKPKAAPVKHADPMSATVPVVISIQDIVDLTCPTRT